MKSKQGPQTARIVFFATLAFAASAFAVPACDGDGNPTPPSTSSSSGGDVSSSTGTGGSGGSSTATGTGGNGTGGAGGHGTGGGDAGPSCDGPNGCFSCAPKKNEEFLNACTTAQCSPFDNAARLPLYNNGNLPPVP